jgi:hypothetical protein
MTGLAERCLAEYDENGWRDLTWREGDTPIAEPADLGRAAE